MRTLSIALMCFGVGGLLGVLVRPAPPPPTLDARLAAIERSIERIDTRLWQMGRDR